ncbi:MAG: hypothetical protein AAF488_01920 [Planctomycetota bacterium]
MRRFGLFVGVFSVGLVLFMALTGQLSRFIQEDRDPFASDDWADDSTRHNQVVIYDPDVKNGRPRFSLRGVIDSSEPLKINDTQMGKRATVRDAVLEMPLYPKNPTESTPRKFTLTASRVDYQPDTGEIELSAGIVGFSDHGARFETEGLAVSWSENPDGSRRIELEGNKPVRLVYPAIELFGESGFEGTVDDEIGIGSLSIKPPVVVALRREESSGFLGLDSSEPGAEAGERIFVISEGPLTIERDAVTRTATARFTGRVSMFNAPTSTSLHPRPDVPKEHFSCQRLTLDLDSTMALGRASAEGLDQPVRAVFLVNNEPYALEGDTLEWVKDREAVLTGENGVSVQGPIGDLLAQRARLRPTDRRCFLDGGIEAVIHAAKLPGAEEASDPRAQNSWVLTADEAVVEFAGARGSGTEGSGFHLIRARSLEPGQLKVAENATPGATLRGTELEYSAVTQTLEVRGGDGQRPTFVERESNVAATVIRLQVEEQVLAFDGNVIGSLHEIPVEPERLPKAMRGKEPPERFDVKCERLALEWKPIDGEESARRRLHRIRSESGPEPLQFDVFGPQHLTLRGHTLEWKAETGRLEVGGEGRQQLVITEGTVAFELAAATLSFEAGSSIARASGDVDVKALRSFLVQRPLDADEDRWAHLECDEVQVELRPLDSNEDQAETKDESIIVSVVASAAENGWVTIHDGMVSARGRALAWTPQDGGLTVDGDGLQRFEYTDADGDHALEARSIRAERVGDSKSVKLILDGAVTAELQQRFPAKPGQRQSKPPIEWEVRTDHLEAILVVIEPEPKASSDRDDEKAQPRVELDTLLAEGEVEVRSSSLGSAGENDDPRLDGPVVFNGKTCEWDRTSQRLRVHSGGGEALQSVRLGEEGRRDEIVAREIVVGRRGDSVWIFFQDVLRATFHVDEATRKENDKVPDSFRMLCDNLLINLVRNDRDAAPDENALTLREAIAWKSVSFKGGTTQIVAERAVFRAATQSVTFHGLPGQPPRVIDSAGSTPDLGDPIVVHKRRNGFAVDIKGRGTPIDLSQIRAVLKLLEKNDRSPGR